VNPWLTLFFGVAMGWLIDFLAKIIIGYLRERKEVKDNDYIDISGEWFAAWQTSVNGIVLLNTESILIKQQGKSIIMENRERAPENPDGGYLWKSKMQFYQGRNLMGWYFPLKSENNSSKGIMYMSYFSPQKLFYGKWVGSGYDGELSGGFMAIAKTRESAKEKLKIVIAKHPNSVNIISYHI